MVARQWARVSGLRWVCRLLFVGTAILALGSPARAIPAFARRYGVSCERCHTMVPRLNYFGYVFYKAGYRTAAAQDNKSLTFTNLTSWLAEIHLQDTNPGGSTGFDVGGAELQVAGAVTDRVSAHLHFTFTSAAEAQSGFEEAYVRYNTAPLGKFVTLQAGQIPLLTGFKLAGGREATITPSLWYGQVGSLTGNGQGNLAIGDLERGAELGVNCGGFNTRFSLLNGVNEAGEGAVGLSGHRLNDWMIQSEYLIGKQGGSVSGFYYKGKTPLTSMGFDNSFSRAGAFANWTWNLKRGEGTIPDLALDLDGAYFWGHDKLLGGTGASASSNGSIVELSLYHRNRTALIARYDSMKPSADLGTTSAFTLAAAHRPSPYYRYELEYRNQMRPGADSLIGSLWFFY